MPKYSLKKSLLVIFVYSLLLAIITRYSTIEGDETHAETITNFLFIVSIFLPSALIFHGRALKKNKNKRDDYIKAGAAAGVLGALAVAIILYVVTMPDIFGTNIVTFLIGGCFFGSLCADAFWTFMVNTSKAHKIWNLMAWLTVAGIMVLSQEAPQYIYKLLK